MTPPPTPTFLDATGRMVRICRVCKKKKDLETEFWGAGYKSDGTKRRRYICNKCALEEHKRYRKANPQIRKEQQQRYVAKVKADPIRHAKELETRRIEYHLRREREGKPVTRKYPKAIRVPEKQPRLPAEPFVNFIQNHLEKRGVKNIAAELGVNDREYRRWRTESTTIKYGTAEKVLMTLDVDWETIWPPEKFPGVYVGLLENVR